jgi:UrcA family protein
MLNKFVALIVITSCIALSSQANAQDREVTQVSVSTYGVSFQDGREVKSFYKRLKRAANEACNSGFDHDLAAKYDDRACAAEALNNAVAQINQPALTLLANGQDPEAMPQVAQATPAARGTR